MKYLFVDIRKSDEVYSKRFDKSSDYKVYNIPMNMIKFNAAMIKDHLEYMDEIYIVCQSSARSQFIKDKYFSGDPKIKVSETLQFSNMNPGINTINLDEKTKLDINVIGSNSFNLYSVMRIIQLILGSMILILGGYTYKNIQSNKNVNKTPLIILLLIGLMALYNGLTSTCSVSILLKDYLN
jgi:hypothetical protein